MLWIFLFYFIFFSLDELDEISDETSDEFADSGSEVEMKVAKPRKLALPAPPVSFAFYNCINVDFPFI